MMLRDVAVPETKCAEAPGGHIRGFLEVLRGAPGRWQVMEPRWRAR